MECLSPRNLTPRLMTYLALKEEEAVNAVAESVPHYFLAGVPKKDPDWLSKPCKEPAWLAGRSDVVKPLRQPLGAVEDDSNLAETEAGSSCGSASSRTQASATSSEESAPADAEESQPTSEDGLFWLKPKAIAKLGGVALIGGSEAIWMGCAALLL